MRAGGEADLIAVVGMAREARILAKRGVTVIVGGGDSYELERTLKMALAKGAKGVISFGLTGGLDPILQAGDIVVGSEVVAGSERYACDPDWAHALLAGLRNARSGVVAGSEYPVATAQAKAELHALTNAGAVDMESHVAARLAARFKVPLAVLRAVSDPYDHTLPAAALAGFGTGGKTDIGAVLRSLAGDVRQLGALMRTGGEAGRAFRSLADARHFPGPGV